MLVDRCPDSVPVRKTVLIDYELKFVDWSEKWNGGVATIVPAPGKRVYGALYNLKGSDEKTLDWYEGVAANKYRKEYIDIDGSKTLVYISNATDESRPNEKYLNVIKQGYKDWNLPLDELEGIKTVKI
jgi:gamma-glutamylcyclotransferase